MKIRSYLFRIVLTLHATFQINAFQINAQSESLLAHIPVERTTAVVHVPAHTASYLLDSLSLEPSMAFSVIQSLIGDEKDLDQLPQFSSFKTFGSTGLKMDEGLLFWLHQPKLNTVDSKKEQATFDMIGNLLIPINDPKAMRSFLDSLIPTSMIKITVPGTNSLQCFYNGYMFNWNSERLVVSFYLSDTDAYTKDTKQINSLLKNYAYEFYGKREWNALTKEKYKASSPNSYVSIWINNEQWPFPIDELPSEAYYLLQSLKNTYWDSQTHIEWIIDQQQVAIRSRHYHNATADDDIWINDVSPKQSTLMKYIQGRDNLFFMQFSVDIEIWLKNHYEQLTRLLEKDQTGLLLSRFFDILSIFIDEDDIYDLWKGHFSLSIYDLAHRYIPSTEFVYNNNTDDYDEVTTYQKELVPLVTMLADYGNESNTDAVLQIIEQVGLIRKMSPNMYAIPELNAERLGKIFIRKNKGVLMVSNDSSLVFSKKPVKKKDRFNKSDWADISTHQFYSKMNLEQLSKNMNQSGQINQLGSLNTLISSIRLVQKRANTDYMESTLSLDLNPSNTMTFSTLRDGFFQLIQQFMVKEKVPIDDEEFKF